MFGIKREKRGYGRKVTIFGVSFTYRKRPKKYKELKKYCDIGNLDKLLANNTIFGHPYGIVISSAASIGENCTIFQHVTIGAKNVDDGERNPDYYPKIGNNVVIYAGATIIGPVKIGDNVVIGANSVVLHDVPANETVVGNPAKIIVREAIH